METTLFWIGCGLIVYGYVLKKLFKQGDLLKRGWVSTLLHVFFTAGVGFLIGFVISASTDLRGPSPKWPVTGLIIGLLWGLAELRKASGGEKGSSVLLAADLEWVETSSSAVILAAVIMYAVVQAFKIPSGSMEDTLLIGDHLFVNKFVYGIRIPYTNKRILKFHNVERGDIVVFQCPESALSKSDRERHLRKDFIKRAIGLPGDVVQIKDKHLYVNGQLQDEPYVIFRDPMTYPAEPVMVPPADYQKVWDSGELAQVQGGVVRDNFGPVKVPEHSYMVMGDNRDGSYDSRFWGPVPNRLLKGRAWVVYWPLNRIKVIK